MTFSKHLDSFYGRGLQPFYVAGHIMFSKSLAGRSILKTLYFIQKFSFYYHNIYD
jgi:hypothetical protein